MMLPYKKQKGVVLIIVLLLTAVMAAVSTEFLVKGRTVLDQSNQMALNARIYLYLQGFQYWAIQTLGVYPNNKGFLPATFLPNVLENASIEGEWQDQQGLFNLNALLDDTKARAGFLRLLKNVQPALEPKEMDRILNTIVRYLVKVNMMNNISELRSLEGINQEIFLSLEKYVTALPTSKHEININGINVQDPKVLLTVLEKPTSVADIQSLMNCKESTIIQSEFQFEEFLRCIQKKNAIFEIEQLTFFSNYYLAIGKVTLNEQQHILYSLLEKGQNRGRHSKIRLIWQSLDTR